MKLQFLLIGAVGLACVAQAQVTIPEGPFSPEAGSEQAQFYAANASAIGGLAYRVKEGMLADRQDALETLANSYLDAALNLAIGLIEDQTEEIAIESAQLLADTLAMTDHDMSMNTMPQGAGISMERIEAARSVLRKAIADSRIGVRAVAAGTLANLGDISALERIGRAVDSGLYTPEEAINYFGLAPAEIGAPYIAGYLESGSIETGLVAIEYLGTLPEYQDAVRDKVLTNTQSIPALRAKAAEVLGVYDDRFPFYAVSVLIDNTVPPVVAAAVVEAYVKDIDTIKMQNAVEWNRRKQAVETALVNHPNGASLLKLRECFLRLIYGRPCRR